MFYVIITLLITRESLLVDKDNRFWQFSVAVYQQPQVAQYCLALQNNHGLNVNLVLLCLWHGQQGNQLSREFFQQVLSDTALNTLRDEVIKPMRLARDVLKMQAEPRAQKLRVQVKRLELLAEQAEQARLYDGGFNADVSTDWLNIMANNLQAYLQIAELEHMPLEHFLELVCVVFPEVEKNLIEQAINPH